MLLYVHLTFYSKFVTTITTELAGHNLVSMFNPVIAVIFVILSLTLALWGNSGFLGNFAILPTGCGDHSVWCCFLLCSASGGSCL